MKIFTTVLLVSLSAFAFAPNAQYNALINDLKAEVKKTEPNFAGFSRERGRAIFFAKQTGKDGQPINCASCHTDNLKQKGKNLPTGKIIDALAPSVNAARLTDKAEMEKWLKRNFKQVYGREGTAKEKGDSLEFIAGE
jgi:mono/diheme cytochrome c family protein